jgi:hypothetical protein
MARIVVGSPNLTQPLLLYPGLGPAMLEQHRRSSSSREDRFSKTLFTLSRCRIVEDNSSGDLLSRSQMHVDELDEVALAAQQPMRQKN